MYAISDASVPFRFTIGGARRSLLAEGTAMSTGGGNDDAEVLRGAAAAWRDAGDGASAMLAGTLYRLKPVTSPDGGTAWRVGRLLHRLEGEPFNDWISLHADREAAMADAAEHARHVAALKRFGRKRLHPGRPRPATPWGRTEARTWFADGVEYHHVGAHGGFRLSPARNETMPGPLRIASGWYAEGERAARVMLALAELFTDRERRLAADAVERSGDAVVPRTDAV